MSCLLHSGHSVVQVVSHGDRTCVCDYTAGRRTLTSRSGSGLANFGRMRNKRLYFCHSWRGACDLYNTGWRKHARSRPLSLHKYTVRRNTHSILSVSSELHLFFSFCFFFLFSPPRTLRERGLSKNICLTSSKSLPADVLCCLPGGSIRLSEGGGGSPPPGPFKCSMLQFIRTR